jgi:hypothetical protein
MKTKIHVNQHIIKSNSKTGNNKPVITVKDYKQNRYGSKVTIHGGSQVVYSPDNPLPCGAKVWIETQSKVDVE